MKNKLKETYHEILCGFVLALVISIVIAFLLLSGLAVYSVTVDQECIDIIVNPIRIVNISLLATIICMLIFKYYYKNFRKKKVLDMTDKAHFENFQDELSDDLINKYIDEAIKKMTIEQVENLKSLTFIYNEETDDVSVEAEFNVVTFDRIRRIK